MRKTGVPREVRRLTQGHTGLDEPKIYDFSTPGSSGENVLGPWDDLHEPLEGLNCKGASQRSIWEQAGQQMQRHQPLGVKKRSALQPSPQSSDGVPRLPHLPRTQRPISRQGPDTTTASSSPAQDDATQAGGGSTGGGRGLCKSLHPAFPGMEQACPRAGQPRGWFPGASGKDAA